MKELFWGVDIGGTKIAVCAGCTTEDGIEILDKRSFATEKGGWRSNVDKILQLLKELKAAHGEALGIGVSCGSPQDPQKGIILSPPNLPGWDEVPIVDILRQELGVPCKIENDADACALAEYRFGAGKGMTNMVFLTFGTGLGAGLIINGQLYRGSGFCAGEVGHIRLTETGPVGFGKEGSFEGYCSGGGLPQLARIVALEQEKTMHVQYDTAKAIFEKAREGEPVAQETVRRCGLRLGQGLSVLMDILNPDCIVLGSIFVRAGDLLKPHMEEALVKEALVRNRASCQILPAQLGESLGDIAALSIAIEHHINSKKKY